MSASPGPLAGTRVLEVGSVLAGPYATAFLQRLGAEVIKIESPKGGDPYRNWSAEGTPHFAQFNAGKKSLAIDLRDPRGIDAVKRLVATVDVLLHNSRPGRMQSLGLGASECLALNPRLVWVGLTGFGTTGPLAQRPAYDAIAQSSAGLLGILAEDGAQPLLGPALGDMASGMIGAMGALIGLASRERTGVGLVVETSMIEAIISLIADSFTHLLATGETINNEGRGSQSQAFVMAASDGKYVAIHMSTSQKFFGNLVRALGREDLASDPRFANYQDRVKNHVELRSELERLFAQHPGAELAQLLADADVPSSMVHSLSDVLEHPHVVAMGLFSDVGGVIPFLRSPFVIDGVRPEPDLSVPRLGGQSREVLATVMTDDELSSLIADGVVVADGELATKEM